MFLQAQNKGSFRVLTQPQGAIIELGDQTLEYGKFYDIDTGNYVIKAWMAKRELLEKKIHVKDSDIVTVRMKLDYSEVYKKYEFKRKRYHVSQGVLKYGFGVSYLIYELNSISDINKFKDDAERFENEVNLYKGQYEQSFWSNDFGFFKAKYNQNLTNYVESVDAVNRRYRNLQIGAAAAIITTYFGWKIAKKIKKPTYTESPLLSGITVRPNLNNNLGLTINSKF